MEGSELLGRFIDYIIDPAMYLLFAAGFFLFVWGLVQFLWNLNEGAHREDGINHMKWGIIGMFVMVSVQGILMLINNTFELDPLNPDMNRVEMLPEIDVLL